jgi:hypothetical protein
MLKKIGLGAQILSTAKDQATYDQARATAQAYGLDVSRMPPQFDPKFVQSKLDESMTIKDQLEQKWKAMEYTTPNANAVLQAQTSTENNRRSVGAQYDLNKATRDAAATTAAATRDAASIKDKRDTEMKLADDYRTQSKNFKDVVDASNRVKAALPSASKSAASTLAAATSFMKLLDPGSVVRESELGMALAATGAIDRVMNYYQVLQSGKVLTPSQVKDFNDTTDKILQAAKDGQKKVDQSYRGAAQQYGLRPEMVIQELGQNALPGGFKVLGVEK